MINAHHFFTKALSQSDEIQEATHGNIFIFPCDEELDKNPPKPYIVVANRGTQNSSRCKDEGLDGREDNTTIEILVCADDDEAICSVAQLVRDTIATAMASFDADQYEVLGWWLQYSSYSDNGIAFNEYTLNRSTTITYQVETSK